MKDILSKSDKFTSEYCISIVRIGEITPIENSDFLATTVVNGESIVIRKDQVKTGDVLFYASNECALNKDFLKVNNLFEWSLREQNSNYAEVQRTVEQEGEEKAKRMVGFFNKHGRVRAIKLRGVLSMGYFFGLNELSNYNSKVSDLNLEELVNTDFDTVDGELFVKAYVPLIRVSNRRAKSERRQKKVKRFDRLIKNEFMFHYDTDPLPKYIEEFKPDDNIVMSIKVHGTSSIFANVKVKNPIKLPLHKWLFNKFVDSTGLLTSKRITDYTVDYGNVYSSRNIIKNQYINQAVTPGYYGTDVWEEYNEILKGVIPQGMTVYGEIVGYITGSQKCIQDGFDYGCVEGSNKLMPYRITTGNEDGTKNEWNVREVYEWTKRLMKEHPEISTRLMPINIIYEGPFKDLYKNIPIDEHWHMRVLLALRNDKKLIGMELNEPMCKNKVPREGIVVRKNDDTVAEAYKLKSFRFLDKERRLMDAGMVDMEMQLASDLNDSEN